MNCMLVSEITSNVFGTRRTVNSDTGLEGKVAIITGANTGIGKETAYDLSTRGAKIIIGCRNPDKAKEAINDIQIRNPLANISAIKVDLSSFTSIRQFVQQIKELETRIDILVNNAGVFATPEGKTVDGFELQFGTNHLGPFLLTVLLLPVLNKSKSARIVNISSDLYKLGKINFSDINGLNGTYDPMKAYINSKLANVLFTRQLAKRLVSISNIKVYCLSPGLVNTDITRNQKSSPVSDYIKRKVTLTPELGAQTTIYCAVDESLENETGCYYSNCRKVIKLDPVATDDASAERLWELSCELVHFDDRDLLHLQIPENTRL